MSAGNGRVQIFHFIYRWSRKMHTYILVNWKSAANVTGNMLDERRGTIWVFTLPLFSTFWMSVQLAATKLTNFLMLRSLLHLKRAAITRVGICQ